MKTIKINDVLRDNNISKFKFAQDFKLSRPTLDDYITRFENGEKLPKEKYQIIFTLLFSTELSNRDFVDKYNTAKRLYNRDIMLNLDNLDPDNTDYIFKIVDQLKFSVNKETGVSPMIMFVDYVTDSHVDRRIPNLWIRYFNELNSIECGDQELKDYEKKYLGMFYHLNHLLLKHPEELNNIEEKYYESFLKRKKELLASRSETSEAVRNEMSKILSDCVDEVVACSSESDSKEDIIRKVIEKMGSKEQ